jgi:hypothetical protein
MYWVSTSPLAPSVKSHRMMIAISTNDPMMFANVIRNIHSESETVLLTVSMSLATWFMICLRGVVSKKPIGLRA